MTAFVFVALCFGAMFVTGIATDALHRWEAHRPQPNPFMSAWDDRKPGHFPQCAIEFGYNACTCGGVQ